MRNVTNGNCTQWVEHYQKHTGEVQGHQHIQCNRLGHITEREQVMG